MTAEIVVMNGGAVVMAADSAATLRPGKIYNSVDKLFPVSSESPIGAMIFSSAAYAGIPWESIIKAFRRSVRDRAFESVKQCSESFIEYLSTDFFYRIPVDRLHDAVESHMLVTALEIARRIGDRYCSISELVEEFPDAPPPRKEISRRFRSGLSDYIGDTEHDEPWDPGFSFRRSAGGRHKESVHGKFEQIFQQASNPNQFLPLPCVDWDRLWDATLATIEHTNTLRYNDVSRPYTGIVVAGFGVDDITPSVVSLNIEFLYPPPRSKKYCIVKTSPTRSRSFIDSGPGILTYAQSKWANLFMSGIDKPIFREVSSVAAGLCSGVLENLFEEGVISYNDGIDEDEAELAKNVGDGVGKALADHLQNYSRTYFTQPVLATLGSLPKPDMADLADALVSITSLQQRVSTADETVGGPVDVAIITREEGFVWHQRKSSIGHDVG